MMLKKIGIVILLILVLGGGFLFWRINQIREEFSLDQIHLEERMLTDVERGSVRETLELTGNLSAIREKDLSLPFGAEIEEILVEEGDRVEKGDLLLRADETQQRLDYLRAKTDYERARIHGSSTEIEEQKLTLDMARADLEAAELEAPFSGVLAEVVPEEGDRASSGETLFTLIKDEKYQVEVEIDEVEIEMIFPGQEVIARVDAVPGNSFAGEIDHISFRARDNNGVVTLPVRVLIGETHERFRPGLTTELEIIIAEETDVLLVPLSSVYTEEGQDHVIRVIDEEPVPSPVETGIDDGLNVVIKEGLEEGERILINAYMMEEDSAPGFGPMMGPRGGF